MATIRVLTTLLLTGLVLSACGGDDESDASTATQSTPESAVSQASEPAETSATARDGAGPTTDAASAVTNAPAPTQASTATEPAGTAAPSGARFTDCPEAAELAPLYGSELVFNEEQAMTGAIGLVFCPYTEVVAPGTTDNFGMEPIPDEFSITFTDQNIVVPGEGEEIPGLGESASWSGSDLSVWTGEQGMIVSIVFDAPAGDAKTVSIAIAQQVLA